VLKIEGIVIGMAGMANTATVFFVLFVMEKWVCFRLAQRARQLVLRVRVPAPLERLCFVHGGSRVARNAGRVPSRTGLEWVVAGAWAKPGGVPRSFVAAHASGVRRVVLHMALAAFGELMSTAAKGSGPQSQRKLSARKLRC
jgi:hypothetical protein